MSLVYLECQGFRNLQNVSITPSPGLNIIYGENAAGKTSLLEAIFYISYGRSFRSRQSRDLIQHENDKLQLIAKFTNQQNHYQLGIERGSQQQVIRLNQKTIKTISELSALLPIICLHPDSHHLISAGPENRRQYMDWGVFHVEHGFIHAWRQYKKALSQRNAALRAQQATDMCQLWDTALCESSGKITKSRFDYLHNLEPYIQKLSKQLFPKHHLSLDYRQGWPEDVDFSAHLIASITKDREKGFTQYGPHRADIKIKLDGKSAQHSISRGQQKKLVALLKLAQLQYFNELTAQQAVVLYDDLPAELDAKNKDLILRLLSELDVQLFVTAVQKDQISPKGWSDSAMFHVEQGCVTFLSESD